MYVRDFALFTLNSGYLLAVCAARLIAVFMYVYCVT